MKAFHILFLALLIAVTGCNKSNENQCKDNGLVNGEVNCTTVYDPVCGCDGRTYSNSCIAKFQYGIKNFEPGACNCIYPYEGLVVQLSFGSCPNLIRLTNGDLLEPVDLPEGYELKLGTNVQFDYSPLSTSASCVNGTQANISCIREFGCIPIGDIDSIQTDNSFWDPVDILYASVVDDCLNVNFSYRGECEDHYFKMSVVNFSCANAGAQSPPALLLQHEANGDTCSSLQTKTMSFDLSKIRCPQKSSTDFVLMTNGSSFSRQLFYVY